MYNETIMIQDILALSTVGCAVAYTGYSFYRTIFQKNRNATACSNCSAAIDCSIKEIKIK